VYDVVVVAVVAGIIGARLYHVITDYQRFEGHWSRAFEVWKGGLGIWGGVLAGSLAVLGYARWKRYDGIGLLDALAPAIPLAQAIGRFGNWFNQELFGEPTRLPWALEIDRAHRPKGYLQYSTFHPTFLYEALYNVVIVVGVLLWVEHRYRLKRGQSFALYVVLYTFGRFWLENLRIDDAHLILGLRVNAWVSLVVFLIGIGCFVGLGRRPETGAGRSVAASPQVRSDP
jgi:prolipoprotein diacylglyceryl transferase